MTIPRDRPTNESDLLRAPPAGDHTAATVQSRESLGRAVAEIPVRINLDIIGLFSEGLYKSPHKAVEELVTNGYDADAENVHVLLPEVPEHSQSPTSPLWVIDDGHGMDRDGFHQLWCVADSKKKIVEFTARRRKPIGQFGIGKLAAYVLASELTHFSCSDGTYLCTTMNFGRVTGRQSTDSDPVNVTLREVTKEEVKSALADVEQRDPRAWALLFGASHASHWTAAALGDFKDLYSKLHAGRLQWVLRTGLPLQSNFRIFVDGVKLESSKEHRPQIEEFPFTEEIRHIGTVTGTARIYEGQLTAGKSVHVGRSNGYFVRVRGRVINLEDELFGTTQPNYAAWSRFSLVADADGLQEYLLSSREGVRDAAPVRALRECLSEKFNLCRQAYDDWKRRSDEKLDLATLLDEDIDSHIREPLVAHLQDVIRTQKESFYVDAPSAADLKRHSLDEWESAIGKRAVDQIVLRDDGRNAASVRYDPVSRRLFVNKEHPFVDKMLGASKKRLAAELFATAELILEGQLRERHIDDETVAGLLADRDRGLRIMAGETPPTAAEVLSRLRAAEGHSGALERAVGEAFRAMGFAYERRGGNKSGPDGSLWARLGRIGSGVADYRLVYDAKQTGSPSVSAAKCDVTSLEEIRARENATFGFFVASRYAAEDNPNGALNRRMRTESGRRLTLLKTRHLHRLVRLHFRYGITLTELRGMFEECRTTRDVSAWLNALEKERKAGPGIPIADLLVALEEEKKDANAVPNVIAVRARRAKWRKFRPDQLQARLKAVEQVVGRRWLEVGDNGDVTMGHSADEVLSRLEGNVSELAAERSA